MCVSSSLVDGSTNDILVRDQVEFLLYVDLGRISTDHCCCALLAPELFFSGSKRATGRETRESIPSNRENHNHTRCCHLAIYNSTIDDKRNYIQK